VIAGVGIDVVDVDRFAASLARTPALKVKLFTERERERGIASLAARFAAKEALAKSLGAPRGLRWHDAEIVSADDGRPELLVTGTIAAAAEARGIRWFHVSLSHDAGIASAVVVAEM
jgi:holo-[acyl-carrier protein] synthase